MAGQARFRNKKSQHSNLRTDIRDALGRHERLLAEISKHLATLVRLATDDRAASPHLTIAEAGLYLGLSPDSIRRKMHAGDIPYHDRPGCRPYFLKHELDAWFADWDMFRPARPCARKPKSQEDCVYDQERIDEIVSRAKLPEPHPRRH